MGAFDEIRRMRGLYTHSNPLTAPDGAMLVADNAEIPAEDICQPRRGYKDHSSNLPDFKPQQLFTFGGVLYAHVDGGIWYHDGTNWVRKRGAFGAKLGTPSAMWLDTSANVLYVADTGSDVIYSISLTTGRRTVFAGRYGVPGTADGVGDTARFDTPTGICGDGAGNLYVSDSANFTIRKIVIATRTVSTFAGTAGASGTSDGTGSAARFTELAGMWGDGSGSIYFCDGHAIRKATYPAAVVTTFAGNITANGTLNDTGTAARFDNPSAIWGDGAGALYVADTDNGAIRKVTYPGAVVTTFAGFAGIPGTADGTGSGARFTSLDAIVGDGSALYVVEGNTERIRKVTVPGAVVTSPIGLLNQSGSTDAIGTAARFFGPQPIVLADSGTSLIVGDTQNRLLRKVYLSTLYVATIAGVSAVGATAGQALFADGIVVGPD
jgi:sugar lactone lactonase YvrE